MANEEQIERLLKGVDGWNKWRRENPEQNIDLSEVDLKEADLRGATLSKARLVAAHFNEANLRGANLREADLSLADLRGANLMEANLSAADLRRATLSKAVLQRANLTSAILGGADLWRADLRGAVLMEADLSKADLSGANLMGAILAEANLSSAALSAANISNTTFYKTQLGDLDLCDTKGIDNVRHLGPSLISSSTLELSKGTLPELFLRGCGLSDWEIESAKLHQPGLSAKKGDAILYRLHTLRFGQAMQIIPLFISYSHKDEAFVDEMEKHLNDKGIRFWRDIHDTPAGPLENLLERAMRLNPTVLLVLSAQSVGSEWVEIEAENAKELEKELGRYVLCPITLDEAWKDYAWEQRLRRQINKYSNLNFSKWKDKGEFTEMFGRLINELDLFYKEG